MKRKNILALALALLMLFSLAPAALAAELPFPAEWFEGIGSVSLRSLIDENRDQIDVGGGSFQLENVLFLEENVVDEALELCICETTESAMIVDEKALPAGCEIELRREKVRIPDAKTGVEVAEEIRAEKAGRQLEPKEKRIDPADQDRETWYLYLTGTPTQTGNSIFVIWDGAIRLCQVEVLSEKPVHYEQPAVEEPTIEPAVPAVQEEPPVNQEWTDPWAPAVLPPEEQEPATPAPAFVLPTPSVTVTGAAAVEQGASVQLEARVTNDYNPSYQWYVWEESRQQWQALSGATDSRYQPDTSSAGNRAYLCEVTNHGADGQTTTAYSEPAAVQVEAKQELPTPTVVGVTGATRVEQGQSAMLEVEVTNAFNASYQWYEAQSQWEAIDGATGSRYQPNTAPAGTQTYLCQVTNSGYGQTTTAYSEPVTFTVEAKQELPKPSVVIAGATQASVGDLVQLEARVTNGRNLSYQWFASLGYYDAPIQSADATSGTFRPDTSQAGTFTYFCRVTSSDYGQTVTVDSAPLTLTLTQRQVRQISSVTIDAMPSKTSYYDGEQLDTAGLRLLVWYNDGTYERVTTGFTAEPATVRYNNSGMVDAIVRYQGYSMTLPLTVRQRQERKISSVTIDTLPRKTAYNDGDRLDTTGLQLLVKYSDGSYERVSSGFTAGPTVIKYNNTSTANVAVRYQGYTATYQISVRSSQQAVSDQVQRIEILSSPRKTSYTVGEALDTTGLMIRVYSYDGRYLDIGEGFECSPTRFNGTGNQAVIVSFAGKTATFTVAVQEARRVYGLTITSMPANRSYAAGDTISAAGLVLQLQTNSGYETITSGYSISPRVASGTGTQMVTVSYEGLTANYTVEVHANNIPRVSPTPATVTTPAATMPGVTTPGTSPLPSGMPTPSALPGVSASPSPSVTPRPMTTPVPARRNTGVSTLIKVLFVVAILALAGLIGYVLYLRKHDGEEDTFREESPSQKIRNFFSKKDRDDR